MDCKFEQFSCSGHQMRCLYSKKQKVGFKFRSNEMKLASRVNNNGDASQRNVILHEKKKNNRRIMKKDDLWAMQTGERKSVRNFSEI